MSTMLNNIENDVNDRKDNSSGMGILEQNFTQLPTEGKFLFKEFLHNLVSMQEMMTGLHRKCHELR